MKIKELSGIKHGWALFIVDFILPLPLTFFAVFLWYQRTQNWAFTSYVILLPLLFGYIIPGIGTNILKLWAFKWNFMRVGNYFIHHGFMYAPYFALAFYLTFGDPQNLNRVQIFTIIISNSFLQCFLTSWHDYWGVESGMIEIYNRPFREGRSAAEIILDYGPFGYALFGATYAASCLIAYHFMQGPDAVSMMHYLLLLLGGLSMMAISGLHYVIREKRRH